jgi:hypothetical protein
MYAGTERRRRDLPGRFARATWPARHAIGSFVEGLPCNVIGHRWVEIPKSLRRSMFNDDGKRLRFKCSRCGMLAGS